MIGYLERERAIADSPTKKFELHKGIAQAKEEIAKLGEEVEALERAIETDSAMKDELAGLSVETAALINPPIKVPIAPIRISTNPTSISAVMPPFESLRWLLPVMRTRIRPSNPNSKIPWSTPINRMFSRMSPLRM